MFHSQNIQFFVFLFLTIIWFRKSVTSFWVLVHEAGCIFFKYIFWTSLSHQTWIIDRYKPGQPLQGIFWTIWRTGAKFQFFLNLATCSSKLLNNQCCQDSRFEKVKKRQLKIENVNYSKRQISLYCHFNKIVKGPETSFQSPKLS